MTSGARTLVSGVMIWPDVQECFTVMRWAHIKDFVFCGVMTAFSFSAQRAILSLSYTSEADKHFVGEEAFMNYRTKPKCSSVVISLLLSLLFVTEYSYGQNQRNRKEAPRPEDRSIVDTGLLHSMINDLAAEARKITPEKNRPLALVEVADVYWLVDRSVSKELFVSALDSALELSREDRNKPIRRILTLASGRDADLSKKLVERLKDRTERKSEAGDLSLKVALELAESSAADAVRLAESFSGAEDKNGVAWFLFQVARRDLQAAEKFYSLYLNKIANNPNASVGDLLWFAGFAFGYAESYGFQNNNPTKMVGFSLKKPDLNPNPVLARNFLIIALDKTRKTIEQARISPPPVRDPLGGIALYAINYLYPEVGRYQPLALGEWQRLRQEALSVSPVVLQDEVARKIEEITEHRIVTEKPETDSNPQLDNRISLDLAEAEKAVDACQRDRAYASAAFFMDGAKDFNRALSTAELIKDISLRNQMFEYIRYNMSIKAIESGKLNEAEEHTRRVSNPDQLALLYVKMAGEALRQQDNIRAAEMLTGAKKLAEKASEAAAKARGYLAAAALYAQFDRFEAEYTVREAIKAVNQAKDINLESLKVMRKVSLQCSGDKWDRWLGGDDSPEKFSLYDTLSMFSKEDFIGAASLARNLEDQFSRIKAVVEIVKTAIEGQKEKRPGDKK